MGTTDEQRKAKADYMREYAKRTTNGLCSKEGCPRGMYGKSGLCAMHYQRRRTTGEVGEAAPRFMQGATVLERWEAKVNRDGPVPDYAPHLGPCWLWTAGLFSGGYGEIQVDGTSRGAHVVGYELLVGPVPDGLELDHLCRVRACVRPDHLEPVPHRENTLRGNGASAINARKTHCPRGHEYTAENTYHDFMGRRCCRVCRKVARRLRYERTGT